MLTKMNECLLAQWPDPGLLTRWGAVSESNQIRPCETEQPQDSTRSHFVTCLPQKWRLATGSSFSDKTRGPETLAGYG
jgi:hypothetical protein